MKEFFKVKYYLTSWEYILKDSSRLHYDRILTNKSSRGDHLYSFIVTKRTWLDRIPFFKIEDRRYQEEVWLAKSSYPFVSGQELIGFTFKEDIRVY